MSVTTFDTVVLSSALGRETSHIWLGTYYYNLRRYTLSNFIPNIIWTSEQARAKFINIKLEFQFVRISKLEFRITCIKSPISFEPTGSYSLLFQCSINAFNRKPTVFKMPSNEMTQFEPIWLDAAYRDNLSSDDLNREIELKIMVTMTEYNCDSNERYRHQEAEFQKAKDMYFPNESMINDLCYILGMPRLQNIFTGRQTKEFAQLKTLYISRTATFAKDIDDFMRATRSCMPSPVIETRIILNFILNGERVPISDEGVLHLYYEALYLGLNFLVCLCQDVMAYECWTQNSNLCFDAMIAADQVNNETLFRMLEVDFQGLMERPTSQKLFKSVQNTSIKCRFMVLTCERRRKMRSAASGVPTEIPSGQSPKTLTSL